MKKFKIGEVYRVGVGEEKGNLIRITGIGNTDWGNTLCTYETLQGKAPRRSHFETDSLFAMRLEHIKKPECKIVITTDGKTTTAKLYDGRKTIREAKAVCSDSDTFDFNIGAGIALARLTGRPFLGVNLSQPEYNPDDVRLTKPKTLRDVVAERDPDKIDPESKEGVVGCPSDYAYLRESTGDSLTVCPSGKDGWKLSCSDCWDRPYTPKEEAKQEPHKPKTLSEWATEQIIDGVVKAAAESLRNRLRERINNEKTGGNNHE